MNITNLKDFSPIKFGRLKPGDYFLYNTKLFIKMEPLVKASTSYEYNAIHLTNNEFYVGVARHFHDDIGVTPIECEVTITKINVVNEETKGT